MKKRMLYRIRSTSKVPHDLSNPEYSAEPGRDYRLYHFVWKDWIEYAVREMIKGVLICYLFFDSYKAFLFLLPFAIFDYHHMKKQKVEEVKRELTSQFKSMVEAVSASLNAGYSLERAFVDAKRDMELLYEKEVPILLELDRILAGMHMNIPVEQLLADFGRRSGNEDIQNFANVVAAAKKSGGNLIRIIQKTVNSITDKIAVEEEIETLIAAKKLEERIMMVMPYGIILYLRLSNGEFLEALYHNLIGVFCMTVFLIVIYMAELWAGKIMEIQV